MQVTTSDAVIIGGGIAGAGAAYALAAAGSCILLERESQAGYHSTGRSAALFSETYGNAVIRALSVASREFLSSPPEGFCAAPVLSRRGVLQVGVAGKADRLDAAFREGSRLVGSMQRLTSRQVLEIVPVLRPEIVAGGGVAEPDAMDIDVHELHRGFLRGAAGRGAGIFTDAEVTAIGRAGADWEVTTPRGIFRAPVLVNAAGAWADVVGRMAGAAPIGLQPKRRTAFTIDVAADLHVRHWPMVLEVDETLYFKPDAGRLLITPADATPVEPCDVQPEELDIALAAERFEAMTTLTVKRIAARWAGLRSFVADNTIVAGFDSDCPGFFWLAAQGGYGIQTSGAMSRVVGNLAQGRPLPADVLDLGVTEADLAPARLRRAGSA